MEKEYVINKVHKLPDQELWGLLPKLAVDNYLWENNGYKPRVEAAVCYSDTGLHVHFTTWENTVTVRYSGENSHVYKDSCVEFFINPMPEEGSRYMNFETNAAGTMLLAIGAGRGDRRFVEGHGRFGIRTSIPEKGYNEYKGPFWTIQYTIPFDFIKEQYHGFVPKAGKQLKGNFYKCGDETEFPHYGSWNPIDLLNPDFHAPQFFGSLILE